MMDKSKMGEPSVCGPASHRSGAVIWLTGLSGAGKTTLARMLADRLQATERACYILDGDRLRSGLCHGLGFSPSDRRENIRRTGTVAAMFADAGIIAIAALISPYREDRNAVRALAPAGAFIEIHVSTSLQECERRDPKGLYRSARAGELRDFTGIDAPYEAPPNPEMRIDTTSVAPATSIERIYTFLVRAGVVLETRV